MSPSPVLSRSAPHLRGVSGLFASPGLAAVRRQGGAARRGPPLADGLTQERELRGGETHSYPVELQAGQFLRVKVQEQGIDVDVRLLDPRGAVVTGVDSLSLASQDSLEDLAALPRISGSYRPGDRLTRTRRPGPAGTVLRGRRARRPAGRRGRPGRGREGRLGGLATPSTDAGDRAAHHSAGASPRHSGSASESAGGWPKPSSAGPCELQPCTGSAEPAAKDYLRSAALWQEQPEPGGATWRDPGCSTTRASCSRSLGRPDEARQHYTRKRSPSPRASGTSSSQGAQPQQPRHAGHRSGGGPRGVSSPSRIAAESPRGRRPGGSDAEPSTTSAMPTAQLAEGQKALQSYQQCPGAWRGHCSNAELEAYALNNLGRIPISPWATPRPPSSTSVRPWPSTGSAGERDHEAGTLINIGDTLLRLERFDEARKILRPGAGARPQAQGPGDPDLRPDQPGVPLPEAETAGPGGGSRAAGSRPGEGLSGPRGHRPLRAGVRASRSGRARRRPAESWKQALSLAHERRDRSRRGRHRLCPGAGGEGGRRHRERPRTQVRSARSTSSNRSARGSSTSGCGPRSSAAQQDSYEIYVDTLMASPAARRRPRHGSPRPSRSASGRAPAASSTS